VGVFLMIFLRYMIVVWLVMLCTSARLWEMKSSLMFSLCMSDSSSDIICVCVDASRVVIGLLVMISCGLVVRVCVMVRC